VGTAATRTDPYEGLLEKALGLDPARRFLAGDHRAVHFSEADQPGPLSGMGGGDLEAQARLLLDQLAQHRNEQGAAQVVAHRHAERRGRPVRKIR